MDLPESCYETSALIREIKTGQVKGVESPFKEYEKAMQASAGKWWHRNLGGESFADLYLRLRVFLDMLQDEAPGLRVLVVCHGHVIRAFRVLLQDLKGDEYEAALAESTPNCQIRWYTRREAPAQIHNKIFKVICLDMEEPTNPEREDATCSRTEEVIVKQKLSIEQLRARAEAVPQLINNSDMPAGAKADGGRESS